jgi:hypothetical protein
MQIPENHRNPKPRTRSDATRTDAAAAASAEHRDPAIDSVFQAPAESSRSGVAAGGRRCPDRGRGACRHRDRVAALRDQVQSRNSMMLGGIAVSVQPVTATSSSPSMRQTRRSVEPSPSPPEPPGKSTVAAT